MMARGRRLVSMILALLMATVMALPALAEEAPTTPAETQSIAQVAAAAKPSVVGILTTMKANRSTDRGRAAGTGFVYKEGIIITNAHVVDNAQEVKILYSDLTTETVMPTEIFADATSDVAVVKVKRKDLKPLPFANSDELTIGMQVVAIGNPLGFRLGNSVSAGILSGTGRALGSGYKFLQTDAPINPGNSGGPLFNMKGEVIGINSAKMADIGVEGLGFAIPSNTAIQIAETLLKEGKVERAVMGIHLDEGWEAYFGVPDAEGVTIAGIVPDGPAGMTALQPGDKLIKLDDTPISTSDDVYAFLATKKPGNKVKITVRRQGQLLVTTITLASQDELRKIAEEQGVEEGGILIGLSASQIQEAAEFGREWATGWVDLNQDYLAVSGSNYAILFTEYLYVARRIMSAYDFGFNPGVGFQQAVAEEIHNRIEIQFQINSDQPDFLKGAKYYMSQEGKARVQGGLSHMPTYTSSEDGRVVVGTSAVRFDSSKMNPADDMLITVELASGKTIEFRFTLRDLR
ncbi:MAG: S1C family serine protease [Bacillota bacterium]